MKKELIEFIKVKADACYSDDFPLYQILECIKEFFENYQPERLSPEGFKLTKGKFLPPWNMFENPEKTEGWMAFQEEMWKNPSYYLE